MSNEISTEVLSEYYDGTKLLSMRDINGAIPEIYICTSNRSAGKTTYFNRLCVNGFVKKREKFGLIYRFNYELDSIGDKFFKDIKGLFFNNLELTSKPRAKGIYHELFLNGVSCGYAISLNSADQLKKYSHLFSDIVRLLFDEFQSETNHYCSDEVRKLISLHTSIARGQGQQARYVPTYMVGNPVSLLNPYYVAMGISSRLTDQVRFLRGNGFVLEQGYIESASRRQLDAGFNRAFASEDYVAYSAQNVYLNDNMTFIEKPKGISRYAATIRYNGCDYGVREFTEQGIVYCDNKPDLSYPVRISVTTEDHQINYVMLKRGAMILENMRFYFDHGCFRFKDLKCKEALLKAISY